MTKARRHSGDGKVKQPVREVRVIHARNNDPRLDEKAYDLRSRIFTCYVLCTSMLCLVPIVPYYVSKELYKRGYKKGAAISMEIFKCTHFMLVFTLVFIKIVLFLLKKNPALLDNFFVKNQDLAVIVAAILCAIPLVGFVITVRYCSVYDEVKTTGAKLVDVLLSRSYLNDVSESVPVLVCYAGNKGPLFTTESKIDKGNRCDADVVYDVYLYSTSYLLVLPSCFAMLCKLFLQKKKRVALSVSRLLAVSSHVLLSNAIVICAITLMLDKFFRAAVVRLHADGISLALLNGVLISSFILFCAVTFCYYEIGNNVYDSSKEISDNIARSVLKFGLVTVAVNCVCDVFRTKAKLKGQGLIYEKKRFVYDVFRRVISAVLLIPAVFWQVSEAFKAAGKNKSAAVAKRAWLYTEAFMGTFLSISILFYGVLSALPVGHMFMSAEKSAAVIGLVSAAFFSIATIAHDLIEISHRARLGNRERKWENIVMNDDELEFNASHMGLPNLIFSGVICIVDLLNEKIKKRANNTAKRERSSEKEEFIPPVFLMHPEVYASNEYGLQASKQWGSCESAAF